MGAGAPAESIGASEVGEYVYCARAGGLWRAMDGAADPAAAARAAQGLPAGWRPGAALALAARRRGRDRALAGGRAAHHRHDRAVTAGAWLAAVGGGLVVLAVALVMLAVVWR